MAYRRMVLLAIVLVLALVPGAVLLAENRQGVDVYVGPNEVIDNNLYAVGGIVDIEGTVHGNVVAIGASVVIPGVVTGDLNAAGGVLTIPGRVDGEVRTASATATINGTIGKDVTISGGTLSVGPRSRIAQDVVVVGQSATIGGTIAQNLRVYAGDLTIGGTIGGNVRAIVGSLRLTNDAVVAGNLIYTSGQEATIAPGAIVRGTVEKHPLPSVLGDLGRAVVTSQVAISWPANEVGIFLMGLAYVLLFPTFAQLTIGAIWRRPWRSLALGVVLLIDGPLIAILLFILGLSIGGWWLGFMLLGLYAIALVLAYISTALFIASVLFSLAGRSSPHLALVLVVGIVILTLLCQLPIVGGVIRFVALVMGLGALGIAVIQERRGPRRSFEP